MKKFFRLFFGFIGACTVLMVLFLFVTDAGHQLRLTAAESILSSQHRQWAKYTLLSQDELDKILQDIQNPAYINSVINDGESVGESDNSKFTIKENEINIKLDTVERNVGKTNHFKGKVMTISNPKRVKLVSSQLKDHGEQIFVIAERAKALAAINASGFVDFEGHGNGGASTGVVIENGKIKNENPNQKDYVAGITSEGRLITGKYSANEMIALGVEQAAGFKPQLIVNGQKMITKGDGGLGIGPRTAIGQTAAGEIIFVVIDGRQIRSLGATLKDVQDLLYERGAVNAMCMDGGSSSSMYFNGENITIPSSKNNIPRYLPNIWAVIPEAGDTINVEYDGKSITSLTNIPS
ncbi:phosphodiester glycosidase family protein [Paenibacillus sp. PR3]|uniref:Phosphodiester glycosidase family protein n=1 Tax=Paenibacillus terricola TaxID=2763503 RepID=A0ABR8MUF3_9BACL|nr:phosphodiester glycosidase family protein [Paenibacillus terricola]MBD3919240.1 phosphodiester glycosidase family protein [Paenibacillus terricola]